MVVEDKKTVVEGGEVDSSDDESDVPEDDFDIDGEGGSDDDDEEEDVEEKTNSDEDDNESSDDGEKDDINAPVVIGQDNDDNESDMSEDDQDTVNNDDSDDESKEDNEHETDEEDEEGNVGWADAMKKVLAMGKNSDKTVSVLSKAKKDNTKKKTVKAGGESIGSDGEEVEKKFEPLALRKARKREIDSIGRKMPDVLERNAEKAFAKIATRGVVQLFNAVREQQKDIKSQLKEAGGSFRKQEKVFKNIDKNSFVELLTGKSMPKPSSEPQAKKPKTEMKEENDENQSSWNILRDDFMLGAKMRDWDKESDGE